MTTNTRDLATQLTLDRLGPSFGAEVIGLDLTAATDDQIAAISAAVVEYKVLFFRGQDLTDDDQVAFGRRLGDLTTAHPVAPPVDLDHPAIYSIDSTDPDFSFSDVWHTVVTFMEHPPLGSILRAVELPPTGGDTSWADSQLAYASLSAPCSSSSTSSTPCTTATASGVTTSSTAAAAKATSGRGRPSRS